MHMSTGAFNHEADSSPFAHNNRSMPEDTAVLLPHGYTRDIAHPADEGRFSPTPPLPMEQPISSPERAPARRIFNPPSHSGDDREERSDPVEALDLRISKVDESIELFADDKDRNALADPPVHGESSAGPCPSPFSQQRREDRRRMSPYSDPRSRFTRTPPFTVKEEVMERPEEPPFNIRDRALTDPLRHQHRQEQRLRELREIDLRTQQLYEESRQQQQQQQQEMFQRHRIPRPTATSESPPPQDRRHVILEQLTNNPNLLFQGQQQQPPGSWRSQDNDSPISPPRGNLRFESRPHPQQYLAEHLRSPDPRLPCGVPSPQELENEAAMRREHELRLQQQQMHPHRRTRDVALPPLIPTSTLEGRPYPPPHHGAGDPRGAQPRVPGVFSQYQIKQETSSPSPPSTGATSSAFPHHGPAGVPPSPQSQQDLHLVVPAPLRHQPPSDYSRLPTAGTSEGASSYPAPFSYLRRRTPSPPHQLSGNPQLHPRFQGHKKIGPYPPASDGLPRKSFMEVLRRTHYEAQQKRKNSELKMQQSSSAASAMPTPSTSNSSAATRANDLDLLDSRLSAIDNVPHYENDFLFSSGGGGAHSARDNRRKVSLSPPPPRPGPSSFDPQLHHPHHSYRMQRSLTEGHIKREFTERDLSSAGPVESPPSLLALQKIAQQEQERSSFTPPPSHAGSHLPLSPLGAGDYSPATPGSTKDERDPKGKRGRPRKHAPKIPLPPLYVFIRNMLHNRAYNPKIISWVNEPAGVFKVSNTAEFALTWGRMKSNRSEEMNYEKMSRAMRYHYGSEKQGRKGHLAMVKEKRLVYRFGELAINWRISEVEQSQCDMHDLCKGQLCLWSKE